MANTNGNGSKGLSPERIKELLGKSRNRGVYGEKIVDFVEHSDEAGINPREVWPVEFGEKSASAMYQSFKTAADKAGVTDMLTFVKDGEDFYIIHNARYADATA